MLKNTHDDKPIKATHNSLGEREYPSGSTNKKEEAFIDQMAAEEAYRQTKLSLMRAKIQLAKIEYNLASVNLDKARREYAEEKVRQKFPTVYGNYREAMEEVSNESS
jgi:hypothetical protein